MWVKSVPPASAAAAEAAAVLLPMDSFPDGREVASFTYSANVWSKSGDKPYKRRTNRGFFPPPFPPSALAPCSSFLSGSVKSGERWGRSNLSFAGMEEGERSPSSFVSTSASLSASAQTIYQVDSKKEAKKSSSISDKSSSRGERKEKREGSGREISLLVYGQKQEAELVVGSKIEN